MIVERIVCLTNAAKDPAHEIVIQVVIMRKITGVTMQIEYRICAGRSSGDCFGSHFADAVRYSVATPRTAVAVG
ncbi:hypothetical protein AXK59_15915 [Tsukamurella tyrosinosolvens]|nr:hypothetical protein AXK59_15915 [Tsukamurella tyrosinosolvens]